MTTQEAYYQPLPSHWGDHVRDAYFAADWPMPNKIDFAVLFAMVVIVGAVTVAITKGRRECGKNEIQNHRPRQIHSWQR